MTKALLISSAIAEITAGAAALAVWCIACLRMGCQPRVVNEEAN